MVLQMLRARRMQRCMGKCFQPCRVTVLVLQSVLQIHSYDVTDVADEGNAAVHGEVLPTLFWCYRVTALVL
jgi:hypothetical protein